MRSFQILLVCLAVTGFVARSDLPTTSSARIVAEHRRLNGDEIRDLLVGRTLYFVAERGLAMSPHEETYRPDGTLFVRVDRAGSPGTYRIAGDHICLRLGSPPQGPEECRFLLDAGDGRLFVRRSNGGDDRLIRINVRNQE